MNENRRRAMIVVLLAVGGAVFGVAGVGHAYLREWKRALSWFLLALFGSAALIVSSVGEAVPSSVLELPPAVIAGIAFILLISVVDAFLVAIRSTPSASGIAGSAGSVVGVSDDSSAGVEAGESVACPHCGRETDPELDFCMWCTRELSDEGRESD
ncbi:MAG: zinc ribbon domain-containing protein [Haloferacaceae archaeon]